MPLQAKVTEPLISWCLKNIAVWKRPSSFYGLFATFAIIEISLDIIVTIKFGKYVLVGSRQQCHIWNASSHSNIEVKQHWTRMVLGRETACKFHALLSWLRILMLLRGDWTVSIRAPQQKLSSVSFLLRQSATKGINDH